MAGSVIKNNFPSQAVSDLEKLSYDYGLKIAKAIEAEWLHNDYQRGTSRYEHTQANFHRLRLYARGEQSIQKYKDELAIDGDLSYLNLDWKPVPIIPKFVDIVVNGLSQRTYDVKAYSQDPYGVSQRTEYMESILSDLRSKQLNDYVERNFGINTYKTDKEQLPDSVEEFELHMQLNYKQAAEIAAAAEVGTLIIGHFSARFKNLNPLLVEARECFESTVLAKEGQTYPL